MLNRYCVALLTLAAVLLGYVASNKPVSAQDSALPFVTGETVRLQFGSGSILYGVGETHICSVADIRGTYVRCAVAPRRGNAPAPLERWFNMQSVVAVDVER